MIALRDAAGSCGRVPCALACLYRGYSSWDLAAAFLLHDLMLCQRIGVLVTAANIQRGSDCERREVCEVYAVYRRQSCSREACVEARGLCLHLRRAWSVGSYAGAPPGLKAALWWSVFRSLKAIASLTLRLPDAKASEMALRAVFVLGAGRLLLWLMDFSQLMVICCVAGGIAAAMAL